MSFASQFIEQALAASSPQAALERDILTKHFDAQHKLANVEVSRAVKQIADNIVELEAADKPNRVAITTLEKLMASMV